MSGNDRIVKELVRFVKEQRDTNREQKQTNQILGVMLKRIEHLVSNHDKWIMDHEVGLRTHYREIRTIKEK